MSSISLPAFPTASPGMTGVCMIAYLHALSHHTIDSRHSLNKLVALKIAFCHRRYDGPFFEAGKAMGDKRATVAEKGFNRPLKRVIVSASGVL